MKKVKDLIEHLQKFDPEMPVILEVYNDWGPDLEEAVDDPFYSSIFPEPETVYKYGSIYNSKKYWYTRHKGTNKDTKYEELTVLIIGA